MPSFKDMAKRLKFTWWSKWEAWDDQLHRDLAVEKCGLQIADVQTGTFTNFSQLDDALQELHVLEGFLKYGTGRAVGDCNLAIHANRMTRKEAVEIVREKDGIFPVEYLDDYLEFFDLTFDEFWMVLESHVNYDILKKGFSDNKPWVLRKKVR